MHSPKFVHEADPDALVAAVERYDVHHPVLDDPELITWQAYTARAWPTLVLVDPEGYVVAQYAGEGHAHAIDALLAELVEEHRAKGTLQPGDSPYVAPTVEPTELRFPAEAARWTAATCSSRTPVTTGWSSSMRDGAEVRERGTAFKEPNGLCVVRRRTAYVADTVHHPLAGIDLESGDVTVSRARASSGCRATATGALSPWDVAWWQDRVWIAMAGIHQLWTFDPATGSDRGGGRHHERGAARRAAAEAWFAQTSGLAADGDRLWLADPEISALRWVEDGAVHTASGRGCSTSGSATARPRRRCSSTRSASPSCRTGRSRCATPTTARCADTTPRPAR